MLLKVKWYTPDKFENCEIFSDFDSIKVESVPVKHYSKDDDSLSRFINDNTTIARFVSLLKDKVVKGCLLVDTECFYLYLLSDNGNTIERIN